MTAYDDQFGGLHGTVLPSHTAPILRQRAQARQQTSVLPAATIAPGARTPPPPAPADSLGIPDLPPDVAAVVSQILTNDPVNGAARAIAYIRGTDWYKTTYYGIGAGIKSGVIADEAGYRNYVSQATESFQRYYGRAPSAAEIADFLGKGYTPGTIEQIGGGHAWEQANAGEVQYEMGAFGEGRLSDAELQQLGEQQVGRQSAPGAAFQNKLQQAAAKMQRLFEGTLASPNFSIGGAGLAAPSLNPKPKPDVSA